MTDELRQELEDLTSQLQEANEAGILSHLHVPIVDRMEEIREELEG